MLSLIISYLNLSVIFMCLFTQAMGILVSIWLMELIVGPIQITSYLSDIDTVSYIHILNTLIPLKSSSIKNNIKSPNISNIAYDLNSPIFRELLTILNDNPINNETQLKIEQFLRNQSLELNKNKISSNLNPNSNFNISNVLISKLIETKPSLEKIIENYKVNLFLMADNLVSLNNEIIKNTNTKFLIEIMYGRILTIISNNQLLNNKTILTDVTLGLGKEIVNQYLLECFKQVKQSNPEIKFINWKKDNQELIEKTEDTQFKFELGNVFINFMVDLKLLKV